MDKGEETQDSREQEGNQPDLGHGKKRVAEVYALESPCQPFLRCHQDKQFCKFPLLGPSIPK